MESERPSAVLMMNEEGGPREEIHTRSLGTERSMRGFCGMDSGDDAGDAR